jgi:predicted transglutaminase-like protease
MEALRKDEAQAKEFIKKIRALIRPPVVDIATLQSGFKSAMIDPTRKIPEEYLITQEKFKDYLATDLDKNIVDHLKKSIKKNLDVPANRGIMMRELLNFQTELKNNKIDSTVDQDALRDIAGVQMDSKRWLPLLGRKDVNYMRFFSGASVDM